MRVFQCAVILSLLLAVSGHIHAQQHVFRSYTVRDGLSNNAIREIYQDSAGFIWIATWEGLNKYDGHKFTQYTKSNGLPHSMINDVIEISKGRIIVAMNDGTVSEIRNGRLASTPISTGHVINAFFRDRERNLLGAADRTGLLRINVDGISPVRMKSIYSLYELTRTDLFYLAVGDPSYFIILDNELNSVGEIAHPFRLAEAVFFDSQERVWIGTNMGLKMVDISDPERPTIIQPGSPFDHPLLANGHISDIFEDPSGNLWFGTFNGLVRVDATGKLQVFTERDGLPGNRVTKVYADREKNIWVGTYSGLAKMASQSVQIIEFPENLEIRTSAYHMAPAGAGDFIILTLNGAFKYNRLRHQFTRIANMPGGSIAVNGSKKFRVYIREELHEYDSLRVRFNKIDSLNARYIFSATEKNDITVTASAGVTIRFPSGKTIRALDSIRMNNVLWDKNGKLWAGSWEHGLFLLSVDHAKEKILEIRDLNSYGKTKNVRALCEDRAGNIWVGTRYDGIAIFSGSTEGGWKVRQIGQSEGMMSDWIYSFAEASTGDMWVGTLSGISKIITQNNSYRVFNLSRATNFYSVIHSLIATAPGELWGVSDKGLFYFRDEHLENTSPLPVYFSDISLGKLDSNFAAVSTSSRVKLRARQNYAKFEFTSPGFLNEEELLYSYRLHGSKDTAWSIPTNQHTVEYASLSPGNYIFEVKTRGWNGEYGPVSSFLFTIRPPFWQTWWFYLGLALVAIVLVLLVYRYRVRQLMKLHEVRNNIATDLHDDIGSTLTNISILSQLSIDKMNKAEVAHEFVTRIRDEVEHSSQALDDIIWSVNTHNDSLSEIFARMRRFAGDLFDNSMTQCHLEFDESIGAQKLNMALRRDLYLIYKETLNNIHKHANAQNVWIRVFQEEHHLKFTIKDDGRGFDPDTDTHRNGLKNLRYRVARWKGDLRIHSGERQGTTIGIAIGMKN